MTETERLSHPVYVVCRSTVWAVIHWWFRFRVVGAQYIPTTGPVMIASNHISNLDPPVLGVSTTRFINFLAKDELFHLGPFSRLIKVLGAFPISRGSGDRAAIRQAIALLEQGQCLGVFPEGHRSKDGKLGPGQSGAAFIAKRAGCPVVPMAIIGPYGFRRRLTVRFGPPLIPGDRQTTDEFLRVIMGQIGNLLEQGHTR